MEELTGYSAWSLERESEIMAFAVLFPNGSFHCSEIPQYENYIDDLMFQV